jgi:hypothetical protein
VGAARLGSYRRIADVEPREIEWNSAEVSDGLLTLSLSNKSSKAWKSQFDAVARLLSVEQRSWGEVSLTKAGIAVQGVSRGSEDELRHLLESIVMEVNAAFAPEPVGATEETPRQSEDREIAEAFRAFATESDSARD